MDIRVAAGAMVLWPDVGGLRMVRVPWLTGGLADFGGHFGERVLG